MRILINSHYFSPSVGGIERVTEILAKEFVRRGHQVLVLTETPGGGDRPFDFSVCRRPSMAQLWSAVRWSEVFLHNNLSLRAVWPLLFLRRRWVIGHHIWLARTDGGLAWQDYLKRFLLRWGINLAISRAVAEALPVPAEVVGDPYEDALFRVLAGVPRDRQLIFVGRLVSDKGADLLLQALQSLRQRGQRLSLTVVGDGPERADLEDYCRKNLSGQVHFAGTQRGEDLVRLLNRHRLLIVPSRWREPFGLVALEGLASGCVVVGTAEGGLADAIGPCGLTVPNGDAEALAQAIATLDGDPDLVRDFRQKAPAHLQKFQVASVADRYLQFMEPHRS